jgi:polysaccharide export outer membrane protein
MKAMKTLFTSMLVLAACLAAPRAGAQTDYTVGAQDVLTITVFGETELSGRYTVEQDGTFTFPQIGRVKAGGTTLRGLELELRQRLADGYLRNPQVSVSIDTYRSQRVLVIGEVRSPGEFQLTGEMTLLMALAKAGLTTPAAGRDVVVVRAPKKGGESESANAEPEVLHIDLSDLQAGNAALNVRLLDGDTVNVPRVQSIFVSGEVKSPGAYAVEPGTTVLQVLTLAGGLTDRGSNTRIRLQRTVGGKQTDVAAKPNDVVNPGDTVIVKPRFF